MFSDEDGSGRGLRGIFPKKGVILNTGLDADSRREKAERQQVGDREERHRDWFKGQSHASIFDMMYDNLLSFEKSHSRKLAEIRWWIGFIGSAVLVGLALFIGILVSIKAV